MDTTQTITHVGLCAGYGGIELGLKRVLPTLRTIALSEIEAFACANLVAKMEAGLMDPAPIWTDLKSFPWADFRDRVDILSGGYPCQPFSSAGKRLGADDPRHLWPFISARIAAMRPKLCFFENVEGHISLGLPDVIEDLAGMGYRATWGIFSAAEVGAPHQRKRVFILATAAARDYKGTSPGYLYRTDGKCRVDQLPVAVDQVEAGNWPTPTVQEAGKIGNQANHGQLALSNHPELRGEVTREKFAKGKHGRVVQANLNSHGNRPESWATPRCSMAQDKQEDSGRHRLGEQTQHGTTGKLNPKWCETLMGLPVGWVMPSCASPVTTALTSCGF